MTGSGKVVASAHERGIAAASGHGRPSPGSSATPATRGAEAAPDRRLPPGQPLDLQERHPAAVHVADLPHVEPPHQVTVEHRRGLVRDSPSSPHAPAPENRRDVSTDGERPRQGHHRRPAGACAAARSRPRRSRRPAAARPRTRPGPPTTAPTPAPRARATGPARTAARSAAAATRRRTHRRRAGSPGRRERVEREQVGQRPRLRLRDRGLGGALEHAVPGVGVRERGAAVEAARRAAATAPRTAVSRLQRPSAAERVVATPRPSPLAP